MRLINADEFKKKLENAYEYTELGEVIDMLDNTPTVEPKTIAECIIAYGDGYESARRLYARPQGEWITFPTNHSIIQCPECTALLNNLRVDVFKDKIGKMNFCPNCGAAMRGKEE